MKIIKSEKKQYAVTLSRGNKWLVGGFLCAGVLFQTNQVSAQTVTDGLRLVETEQTGKALQLFNKLISSNPKDASLYYYRGYTYIQREKLDSALVDFNQGISINPKEGLNYAGKGYALLNQNKVQEAEASFDQGMSVTKNKKANVLNAIADAYLNAETKNLVKAKTLLERSQALEEGKTNPQTYLLLGDAYLAENNGGKAVSNYERASELNKTIARPFYSIARVWARGRNYPLSLENFQKALSIDPNYCVAQKELGELYYRTNQVQKAKDAYAQYLNCSEIRGANRERYIAFLFLSKDYPGAIRELNEALPKNPESVVLNRLMGYSTYETGDYGRGIQAMEKFFTVSKPDKILASDYAYYGKNLVAANCDSLGLTDCTNKGIENLKKAVALDTTEVGLEYRKAIAEAYKKNKQFSEAAQEYQYVIDQKLKLNPNDKTVANDYFDIGKFFNQAEQFVQADSAFSKVTLMFPDMWQGHYFKAIAESNLDPDQKQGLAKPSWEKLISIIEADPTTKDKFKKQLVQGYKYLGAYYLLVKEDKSQALDNWNKVLAYDSEDKQAKEAVDFIKNGAKPKAAPKTGTKTTKGASAKASSKGTKQ